MNTKNLFIFGGRSTALEIFETAILLNFYSNIYMVVSDSETITQKNTIKESDLRTIINANLKSYFIVSISNQKIKEKCLKLGHILGLNLVSIIHPTSLISTTSKVGKGVYLAANSIISNNAIIEKNCMINYQVVIGHDSKIQENCVINPGAVIGGNSIIEKNVLIGANSVIKQNLKISAGSKIDALTYVYFDVEKDSACTSRNTKVINL